MRVAATTDATGTLKRTEMPPVCVRFRWTLFRRQWWGVATRLVVPPAQDEATPGMAAIARDDYFDSSKELVPRPVKDIGPRTCSSEGLARPGEEWPRQWMGIPDRRPAGSGADQGKMPRK